MRSPLHALSPIGRGTSEVESLISYFCRLAVSHSTTTDELGRFVVSKMSAKLSPKFNWHALQISGLGEAAMNWSSVLTVLTGIDRLDDLTFLHWRNVIAQNGRSIVAAGQYCPMCLNEDSKNGKLPYLRLVWESAETKVCYRHGVRLQHHCSSCGRSNIRHASAIVVPGWCTNCGAYLGYCIKSDQPTDSLDQWKAHQLSVLIASKKFLSNRPERSHLIDTVRKFVVILDGGQSACFANRIGLAKSTVHSWLNGVGTPKLDASLRIAFHSGLSLAKLLTGDVKDWTPPDNGYISSIGFELPARKVRAQGRQINWIQVEEQLQAILARPEPISVTEAARQLSLDPRQLYARANRVTREIGARWRAFARNRREHRLDVVRPHLEAIARIVIASGRAFNRREALKHLPKETLSSIPNLDSILAEIGLQVLNEQVTLDNSADPI